MTMRCSCLCPASSACKKDLHSVLASCDAIGDRGSDRGLPRHEQNGDLVEVCSRVEKNPVKGPNRHDHAPSLGIPALLRVHSCAESSKSSADRAADQPSQ